MKQRCPWPKSNPLMIDYHDREWGVPLHDDRKLFEFFVLDAFQAGLSWEIVLNKRKNFERAFGNFDYKKIARYTPRDISRLTKDWGIIRNQLKIKAAVTNAQKFLAIIDEFGSFDRYIWQFVNGKPIIYKSKTKTTSKESDAMSRDLKRRGFKFVGSTICYAFMQAAGLVNDHLPSCFRYKELVRRRR